MPKLSIALASGTCAIRNIGQNSKPGYQRLLTNSMPEMAHA